jgi:hypothetical protein
MNVSEGLVDRTPRAGTGKDWSLIDEHNQEEQ